jgi:inosose dehydratase
MRDLSRRTFMHACAWGTTGAVLPGIGTVTAQSGHCTLSFSTYGMKTVPTEDAVSVIADTGYDGIEITVWPDWDAAPSNMSPERRKRVRGLIEDKGLKLTSLMEHIAPTENDVEHAAQVERLRGVAQLANDLASGTPPLIQTVLGGGTWDEKKELFAKRLPDWVDVCQGQGIALAIKPHRGGGMSRPSEAAWLIKRLETGPWLRMVYDYSHYAFRDMPLEETVEQALPYLGHVAVKDAVKEGEKIRFVLPGESGEIDYAKLIRLLYDGGYRGDICCEISGQVWNVPGYDPVATARTSYTYMAAAFEKNGVPRPI